MRYNRAVPALDYFEKGGPVMWALLVCSLLAVTVFVERLLALRPSRTVPHRLIKELEELVRTGKLAEALARAMGSDSAAGHVFAAVLRKADASEDERKAAAEDVGRREAARLERLTEIIGVVSALGPLLGLLGTVLGMIKVFQKVNEVGAGSPVEMAAGIWEALIATAFGLLVGIPALVMYRIVLARADAIVLALEDEAVALVDAVTAAKKAPPA
jgi:biopolymer transport protein ExbB